MTVSLICCSETVGSWQLLICIKGTRPQKRGYLRARGCLPGVCPEPLSLLTGSSVCSENVFSCQRQPDKREPCTRTHRARAGRAVQYHPASRDAERSSLCSPPKPADPSPRVNGLPEPVIDRSSAFSSQSAFSGRSCGLRVGLLGWGLSLGSPPPRPHPGYRAWSIISSPRLPQGTWGLPSERGHPPLPAPLGRRSREPPGPAGGLENWSHLQN